MKKHILVSSVLFASLASNCMEQANRGSITCHMAKLNTKAQERIAQEAKVTFSLTDQEIQELQAIHTKRHQIIKSKNELFNKTCFSNLSPTDGASYLSNIKNLEKERDDLTHQLDLVQKSKNLQTLNRIKSKKVSTKPEQDLSKYLEVNQIPKENMILGCTTLIDLNAKLYREIEAIYQFTKHQTNELFGTTESICPWHMNAVTLEINALIDTLETLSQEQTSDK